MDTVALFEGLGEQKRRKQSRARWAAALEKGTLFYIFYYICLIIFYKFISFILPLNLEVYIWK